MKTKLLIVFVLAVFCFGAGKPHIRIRDLKQQVEVLSGKVDSLENRVTYLEDFIKIPPR